RLTPVGRSRTSPTAMRFTPSVWHSACTLWRCRAYCPPLVACSNSPALSQRPCAGPGVQGEQVGPQPSRLRAQRLALGEPGRRETPQPDEADDTLGDRLFVGHASASSLLAHTIRARTDVCPAARAIHPRPE